MLKLAEICLNYAINVAHREIYDTEIVKNENEKEMYAVKSDSSS